MENIFAQRLKDLRERSKFSYQDVADPIGVTKQSIYKFEKGEANPRSDTVLKLAEFFRVPYSYFYESDSTLDVDKIRFRDGHKLFDKEGLELELKEQVIRYLEKFFQLENLLDIDREFENPLAEMEIESEKDIEKAAKIIRKKWKIGMAAIPDVVDTLENNGIVVIEMNRFENFEGLSGMVGEETPIVVLNENTLSTERKRFTALHELGHIVLDFAEHITENKMEYLCNCFAGAFLLVDEALYAELGKSRTTIALSELLRIRANYGISVQAIILRAKTSGFIDNTTYNNWWRTYEEWSREGNSVKSSEKFQSDEKSSRFMCLIVQGVNEKRISWSKAAELSGRKIDALKRELDILNFSIRN